MKESSSGEIFLPPKLKIIYFSELLILLMLLYITELSQQLQNLSMIQPTELPEEYRNPTRQLPEESQAFSTANLKKDELNEDWAKETRVIVISHQDWSKRIHTSLVPLYKAKFTTVESFNQNEDIIKHCIFMALSSEDQRDYANSDNSPEKKNVRKKITYYIGRIKDAVYPELNDKKRKAVWNALAAEERQWNDYMLKRTNGGDINDVETVDSDVSKESFSSSNTWKKRLERDNMGIEYWMNYYTENFINHYPAADLKDAIHDLWFQDTLACLIEPDSKELKVSTCGFYLYEMKGKVKTWLRRTTLPMVQTKQKIIICCEPDLMPKNAFNMSDEEFNLWRDTEFKVGNETVVSLNNSTDIIDGLEELEDDELINISRGEHFTKAHYYFSQTNVKVIPHSRWFKERLFPICGKVPRSLLVVKNTMGRGVVSACEDYYKTNTKTIQVMLEQVDFLELFGLDMSFARVYDPCAGDGVFGKVLSSQYPSCLMIERDKFPKSSSIKKADMFQETIPSSDFDVLITNPPFCVMNDVLRVCFNLNKPFVLLLPRRVTQTGVRSAMLKANGVRIFEILPAPKFEAHLEHGKVEEKCLDCVWIMWHPNFCGGGMTFDTILCAKKIQQSYDKTWKSFDIGNGGKVSTEGKGGVKKMLKKLLR